MKNPVPLYTSETARRFERLQRQHGRYLLLNDDDVLPILLGAVAAHRLDGEPSWLLVVGPPSSAKTDLLGLFTHVPDVTFLSDLTDKTLASGWAGDDGDDASLLARLEDGILIFKDFTTVLEMRRDQRAAVLAQLREVYDGRFDKTWGTGKDLHWRGRLSLLAGVTPVIDKHYSVMSVLGQRFMLLRPRQPNRRKAGLRALENCSADGVKVHDTLAKSVHQFLARLPEDLPVLSTQRSETITELADLTTRARSAVERDGRSRELDYVPEPEMPARFARQLLSLARGVALVKGHRHVTGEDMACVRRVALDSIPTARRRVLRELAGERFISASKLLGRTGFSESLVRRALEDLHALGVVDRVARSGVTLWRVLESEARGFLEADVRDQGSHGRPI
jgi:hypothetical protein